MPAKAGIQTSKTAKPSNGLTFFLSISFYGHMTKRIKQIIPARIIGFSFQSLLYLLIHFSLAIVWFMLLNFIIHKHLDIILRSKSLYAFILMLRGPSDKVIGNAEYQHGKINFYGLKPIVFAFSGFARPPLADNFIYGLKPVELRQNIKLQIHFILTEILFYPVYKSCI